MILCWLWLLCVKGISVMLAWLKDVYLLAPSRGCDNEATMKLEQRKLPSCCLGRFFFFFFLVLLSVSISPKRNKAVHMHFNLKPFLAEQLAESCSSRWRRFSLNDAKYECRPISNCYPVLLKILADSWTEQYLGREIELESPSIFRFWCASYT